MYITGLRFSAARYAEPLANILAPAVIREIIAHPDMLKLGGEERELTLMFCDVRNFTSVSQDLSATDLTQFINELLSPLSDIILQQRGTIDKYMGDAIMAFWNAPLDDPDHRIHACRAALAMAAKMDELNEMWRQRAESEKRAYRRVEIGIGLNTGPCCVGNLGSTHRFRLFGDWRRGKYYVAIRGTHENLRRACDHRKANSRAGLSAARIGHSRR